MVPPLTGYDGPGHAGYILTILTEHRLPHPTEGWSTFHPPLYYLLGTAIWWALEPLGPQAVVAGLRLLGGLPGVAAGWVSYRLVRRLGGDFATAWMAAALVLFLPAAQMAAAMEGNEAFAAGVAAMAFLPLLALQRDPRDVRAAAMAGMFSGLAVISKFSGFAVAAAGAVPFARRDLDARALRALGVAALLGLAVAAPVYARNVALTGRVFPMARDYEPMRSVEQKLIIRPRRVADYFWVDRDCLLRPSMFHLAGLPARRNNRNPAMVSVPGLLHASLWYDPFGHRVPIRYHEDGVRAGPTLVLLGLVPTAATLLGFAALVWRSVRSAGRAPEAPFVAMAALGTGAFLAYTWISQSSASVKGSYLLPLAPAAAVFFAEGVRRVGRRAGAAVLAVSGLAVIAAAVVFTEGLVFDSDPLLGQRLLARWSVMMPSAHLTDAVTRLLGQPM